MIWANYSPSYLCSREMCLPCRSRCTEPGHWSMESAGTGPGRTWRAGRLRTGSRARRGSTESPSLPCVRQRPGLAPCVRFCLPGRDRGTDICEEGWQGRVPSVEGEGSFQSSPLPSNVALALL